MNVVQINYAFDAGLEDPDALLDRYSPLTGWSEALAGAGAARVLTVQRFRRDARVTRNGIEYIFCASGKQVRPRSWTWPHRLHRMVAGASPAVVHINGLIFPVQAWQLRRTLTASSAIVVQDHGTDDPAPARVGSLEFFRQAAHRRAFRAVDGFLFAAAPVAEPWRRAGFIASTRRVYEVMEASTTLHGVPRADARRTSGVDGMPAVLWVGRLNSNKDPLTILDGFLLALARLPEAVLTMIYSEADLVGAVRDRLSASPLLQTHVRLVGPVPHDRLAAFYSAADLFVLGSHHEGSGYALIEACACGAAPVVTNIPTFRAITADGSLGALWTPGDAAGFARALVDAAERDGPARRARIVQHFDRALSWPAIGRQAMAAYHDVVTRRRTRLGSGH